MRALVPILRLGIGRQENVHRSRNHSGDRLAPGIHDVSRRGLRHPSSPDRGRHLGSRPFLEGWEHPHCLRQRGARLKWPRLLGDNRIVESPSVIAAPAVFLTGTGKPPDDPNILVVGKRHGKRESSTCDVLLVEDEAETRDAMLELLAAEGYEALGAANGLEALSLLENGERPSLILLDL